MSDFFDYDGMEMTEKGHSAEVLENVSNVDEVDLSMIDEEQAKEIFNLASESMETVDNRNKTDRMSLAERVMRLQEQFGVVGHKFEALQKYTDEEQQQLDAAEAAERGARATHDQLSAPGTWFQGLRLPRAKEVWEKAQKSHDYVKVKVEGARQKRIESEDFMPLAQHLNSITNSLYSWSQERLGNEETRESIRGQIYLLGKQLSARQEDVENMASDLEKKRGEVAKFQDTYDRKKEEVDAAPNQKEVARLNGELRGAKAVLDKAKADEHRIVGVIGHANKYISRVNTSLRSQEEQEAAIEALAELLDLDQKNTVPLMMSRAESMKNMSGLETVRDALKAGEDLGQRNAEAEAGYAKVAMDFLVEHVEDSPEVLSDLQQVADQKKEEWDKHMARLQEMQRRYDKGEFNAKVA